MGHGHRQVTAGDGRHEMTADCPTSARLRATSGQPDIERQAEPTTASITSSPMLEVRDLHTPILKTTSFALGAGECIALRGPSGAGKTLLLRAIADLDPNAGSVRLQGRDRSTIPAPEWRRLVGYVPAEPGWWAETVGQHFIDWPAALVFISQLGFPHETRTWPITRLSTGERLRLALARALIIRPKVLLLDEPTAALDAASVAAVETLISSRMQSGLAVLWVTHDSDQAMRMAHRQLVVEAGFVREEDCRCPATSP